MKINPDQIPTLLKGIITNLVGAGIITQFLPNREQERLERESERLMDRAERLRDENNRRLQRK